MALFRFFGIPDDVATEARDLLIPFELNDLELP